MKAAESVMVEQHHDIAVDGSVWTHPHQQVKYDPAIYKTDLQFGITSILCSAIFFSSS